MPTHAPPRAWFHADRRRTHRLVEAVEKAQETSVATRGVGGTGDGDGDGPSQPRRRESWRRRTWVAIGTFARGTGSREFCVGVLLTVCSKGTVWRGRTFTMPDRPDHWGEVFCKGRMARGCGEWRGELVWLCCVETTFSSTHPKTHPQATATRNGRNRRHHDILRRVLLRIRYSTWVLSCALRLSNLGRNTDRRSRRVHLVGQTRTGKCILCPVDSTEAFGRGGQTPISDDVARRREAFSVIFGDVKGLDEGTDRTVRAKVFFPSTLVSLSSRNRDRRILRRSTFYVPTY